MPRINKKIVLPVLVLVIVIVGLIVFLNRPSTVQITSEQGANISISADRNEDFNKIGTSTASYKTSKLPTTVYIQVKKDGRETLSSVLLERGKNQSINLSLANTLTAQKITSGSVFNAYFNGTLGQGIVHGENVLTSFRTDRFAPPRPEFAGMPYVKKVIWYDQDNFVYQTLEQSVGQFINGSDIGTNQVGSLIVGDVQIDNNTNTGNETVVIEDIAKFKNKPLVLMSANNIFLSDDKGSSLRVISKHEPTETENNLFTSEASIFRAITHEAGDVHEDEDQEVNQPSKLITEYDYSGKELGEYSLDDQAPLVSIVKRGEVIYILTRASLHTIDKNGDISEKVLYFNYAQDMTLYNNHVVLLGNDGLWNIAEDQSLQLLYTYPNNGVGLEGSLSVTSDARLLFGTTPSVEDAKDASAMFSVSF